jgi:outer membrane lipoprotein-sorting protein
MVHAVDMATGRRTTGRTVAAGIAVAGAVGLGLLAVPGGAGAAPELPPVTPEDLVSSVLAAQDPGPFGGTVELDNALGLPPLPNVPQAANGSSTARVWSGGDHRGRIQVPTDAGERTFVADGQTFWSWNSADRTVTKVPDGQRPEGAPDAATTDPTAAATQALAALRPTSEVSVDGTAVVAGRPAYELVLAPAPSERTLLREVRIAVDAEKRVPLQLTVLANGSAEPVLQLGFTDLQFGAQDASLFTFTPPPGATVQDAQRPEGAPAGKPGAAAPTVVGDGWDTVLVTALPAPAAPPTGAPEGGPFGGGAPDLSALGTPVSGPWGSGRLISTAVANAIITDDGRVAAGAVPEQVLTEALAR